MPRIYTSQSDPLDFCQECIPHGSLAKRRFGNMGDGPDGRGNCFGYDAEHPDYEGDVYECYECGIELTEPDN